jgi:hypothetical protein
MQDSDVKTVKDLTSMFGAKSGHQQEMATLPPTPPHSTPPFSS